MWLASFVLLMRGQFRWGYTGGSRTFERGKQISSMKTVALPEGICQQTGWERTKVTSPLKRMVEIG